MSADATHENDNLDTIIQAAARLLKVDPTDLLKDFWQIAGRNKQTREAHQAGSEIVALADCWDLSRDFVILAGNHRTFILAAAKLAQSDPQFAASIGARMAAE